jgi:hypothetical protein
LRLEYRIKHIYYNVDIKNGERDLVLQCLGRCVAIYTRCGICDGYNFVCRVLCGFIDMWTGVVFGTSNFQRWLQPTEDMTNKVVTIADSTSRIRGQIKKFVDYHL